MIEEAEDSEAQPADVQEMGMRWNLIVSPDRIDDQAEHQPDDAIDERGTEEPSRYTSHAETSEPVDGEPVKYNPWKAAGLHGNST
jgi:hypothetical protein